MNILPSVDIFLPVLDLPNFEIDLAVIATDINPLVTNAVKSKNTYHLLALGGDSEGFDLTTNIQLLRGMYNRYKEVILTSDISIVFSQVLFEAAINANKLSLKVSKAQQDILDKVLASLFHNDGNKDVGNLIKSQIQRKHTCINRASRLCRLLKNEEAVKMLDKLGDQICEQ